VSFPDAHLSADAVVAFVDRELSGTPEQRAAQHVDGCPECWSAVEMQRLAKSMLCGSAGPGLSDSLMQRLRAIPSCSTGLPGGSDPESIGPESIGSGFPAAALGSGPSIGHPGQHFGSARLRRGLLGAAAGISIGVLAVTGTSAASNPGAGNLDRVPGIGSGVNAGVSSGSGTAGAGAPVALSAGFLQTTGPGATGQSTELAATAAHRAAR
jgi:Putative zinc-finger